MHVPKAIPNVLLKAAWILPSVGLAIMVIGAGAGSDVVLLTGVVILLAGALVAFIHGLASAPNAAAVIKWCMLLYLAAMLIKFWRFPGASLALIVAFTVPMLLFLASTLTLPFRYKGQWFLLLVGGAAGLVLLMGYLAILAKMMRWPTADLLFTWFAPTYVVMTIVLLVGIQLTDFVQWDPAPRRFLTQNILLPWAFLFLVGGSILLMPKQYFGFVGSELDWGMEHQARTEDL
ncbi:MAG: hypothetical protein JNL43_07435 [Flavobacteriales bacterium]|nr:hypothetical protein [Flavobacteriales bacterium]